MLPSLNAPSGARCFLTNEEIASLVGFSVLMHFLVLGAF